MEPSPAPTQTRYPWRATLRTVAAATLALITVLPFVFDALGVSSLPWAAAFLGVIGTVTRVLAIPAVNDWLHKWAPILLPEPKPEDLNEV